MGSPVSSDSLRHASLITLSRPLLKHGNSPIKNGEITAWGRDSVPIILFIKLKTMGAACNYQFLWLVIDIESSGVDFKIAVTIYWC